MSDQSIISDSDVYVDAIPNSDSDTSVNVNTNNVIISPTPITKSVNQIALHLKKINCSLQFLDEELSKYRKEVKSQMYHFYASNPNKEEKLWLFRKIQNELKVYQYYKQFTLRVLCQIYCYDETHFPEL